jgi:uncharacterized protein YodC (DUF2158 family)
MADDRLRRGDTVKLKSGGPFMTVDLLNGRALTCFWFEAGVLFKEQFDRDTLRKAVPKTEKKKHHDD